MNALHLSRAVRAATAWGVLTIAPGLQLVAQSAGRPQVQSPVQLTAQRAVAVRQSRDAVCTEVPATMRAARLHKVGGPEALLVEQVSTPTPSAGQVLVRVHYASVNPVDWKLQESGGLKLPAIPGGDFSGVVVGLGADVTRFACGDSVAGTVDQVEQMGSYAEYVVAPLNAIVAKPAAFSLAEAAAYPTVAIAAWRFLLAGAKVQRGERVLVHGAAGGVGSMVVQAARHHGAEVIATASARNHDYLRSIGATQVIDYTTTRFEDVVRDVDVVVDAVGGETLIRSVSVLRPGGRLVSSAGSIADTTCARAGIVCPPRAPWDVQRGLAAVAPMISAGTLRVHIDSSYPLEQIMQAQLHSKSGRTRGKVVIDMGADETAAAMVPLLAYMNGHATGLEQHFRRAFAGDAQLIGIKDGVFRKWSASDYIRVSSSGRAPADEARRKRRVSSLIVTGLVATAVIALDYPDMVARDHMTLLKRDNEWRIVVKSYDAVTPSIK